MLYLSYIKKSIDAMGHYIFILIGHCVKITSKDPDEAAAELIAFSISIKGRVVMMTKNTKIVIGIIIVCISLFATQFLVNPQKEVPIQYISGMNVINIEDPKEVVGFGDYVFVARIDEEIRNVNSSAEDLDPGIPMTTYSITVLDNLKGKIKKNTPIEFSKIGGISSSSNMLTLLEGDVMLEEDQYYILVAAGNDDGTMVQAAATGAVKLDVTSEGEIVSSQAYKDYEKYIEEEVEYQRPRYKSMYEE